MKKDVFILVDLDAVLDTRITTHRDMGNDLETIIGEGYKNRVYDVFDGIDYDKYRKAYDNRTKKQLLGAKLTGVPKRLHYLIVNNQNVSLTGPHANSIVIILNTHPYKLSEKETSIVASAFIGSLAVINTRVETVSMHRSEISPAYLLDKGVSSYYTMYGESWLNYHVKLGLADKRCPLVKIHTPFMVCAKSDNIVDEIVKLNETDSPVDEFLQGSRMYITYVYEDAALFSADCLANIYPYYLEPPPSVGGGPTATNAAPPDTDPTVTQ